MNAKASFYVQATEDAIALLSRTVSAHELCGPALRIVHHAVVRLEDQLYDYLVKGQ